MAAPTYFGSASTPADNGAQGEPNTVAVTPPGSMVAGDLVVMIAHVGLTSSSATSISASGGQTWNGPIQLTGGTNVDFQVYWCQYNGTWGANPSVVFPAEAGTIPVSLIMHVFRPDAVGIWRVDQAMAGGAEASASPVVITGITTGKKDTVTLAGWGIRSAVTWGSISGSGWAVTGTAQYRNTTGTDQSASFAHSLSAAAGATGDVSKVPSTATAGASFIGSWYNALTPTVALNTADATNFGSDITPTLEFTGTDGNGDDVRYNVQIDTVNTFNSGGYEVSDSYEEGNQSSISILDNAQTRCAQSFTAGAGGGNLQYAQWYLSKTASPTGNAVAKIYDHLGVYGDPLIFGELLATSDNVDVSTLTGSLTLTEFIFSGSSQPHLDVGVPYILSIEYSGGTSVNKVNVGTDNTSPSHAGRGATFVGSWFDLSTSDFIFFVFTKDPLLNKLSGTDSGFANTVTGGDTDPFNSGEKASFTVQGGDALAGLTYYWRARAKDPNGGNIYSAWATTRTFVINATTTKTQAGKGNIRASTARTQTGSGRLQKTAAQTQTGKANLAVGATSQTQNGLARVQVTAAQTQTGKGRVRVTASAGLAGVARVRVTSPQTQTGKADITATTTRTQTGRADIQATSSQTQAGRGRIRITASAAQTGVSRLRVTASQAQTGKGRLTAATARTQSGKADIQASMTKTQPGVGRIRATATASQQGVSRLRKTASAGQTGKSRLQATAGQAQTGLSRIRATTTRAQSGKAAVRSTTTRNQTGVGKISGASVRDQTGKADIRATSSAAQSGVARVRRTATAGQTGKARLQKTAGQTQTGKGRVGLVTGQAQVGKSRVQTATARTQTGKADIRVTAARTQPGVGRIMVAGIQVLTGQAALVTRGTADQFAVSRIQTRVTRTQSGTAHIVPFAIPGCVDLEFSSGVTLDLSAPAVALAFDSDSAFLKFEQC